MKTASVDMTTSVAQTSNLTVKYTAVESWAGEYYAPNTASSDLARSPPHQTEQLSIDQSKPRVEQFVEPQVTLRYKTGDPSRGWVPIGSISIALDNTEQNCKIVDLHCKQDNTRVYIVSYEDNPKKRVEVLVDRILDFVSPQNYENYEYENYKTWRAKVNHKMQKRKAKDTQLGIKRDYVLKPWRDWGSVDSSSDHDDDIEDIPAGTPFARNR